MNSEKKISKTNAEEFKKKFMRSCSHAFFYLLNNEFGNSNEAEEVASAPLYGGLRGNGHQCGMLWGATLAVGTEAYRRCKEQNKTGSITIAITATKHLMKSFSKRAGSVNCRDITDCSLTSIFGMIKFGITGKTKLCSNLSEDWALEAIQAAEEGLSQEQNDLTGQHLSCATELAEKMGASDEEMHTVAGFAGGMGLSGNACGALSTAIWINSLAWCKENPGKAFPVFFNKNTKKIIKAFKKETDSEFLCHKICGKRFNTFNEHTEFIKNGGCDKLINILAQ